MLLEIFDHIDLCSEKEVARLLPLVSPERREEALRYRHTFGQFCCLQSYRMLVELVGSVSPTLDYTTPRFVFNEFGKPALEGRPDLQFSISHTKNAIAVGLSSQPIGVDVEQIKNPSPALIAKTMNQEEQRRIAEAERPDILFTALWTRKEAVLKLRGTGIQDELHDVLKEAEKEVVPETHIRADKGYVWSVATYREALDL